METLTDKIEAFLRPGSGYGSGYGYGSGDGVQSFKDKVVYLIDGVQTIITHINKNIAKGFILNDDFTLEECYIAKGQNKFAHGETAKKAVEALQEKIFEDLDTDQAIEQFREEFKQSNRKYKVKDLYQWHHILTGSCEMGRKAFARNHDIDIENDKMTIKEFIELTENDYGGEIIKQLKEYYA